MNGSKEYIRVLKAQAKWYLGLIKKGEWECEDVLNRYYTYITEINKLIETHKMFLKKEKSHDA